MMSCMKSSMAPPTSFTLHNPTILPPILLLTPLPPLKFQPAFNLKKTKTTLTPLNCSNTTTTSWSSETYQESSEEENEYSEDEDEDEEEGSLNEEGRMGGGGGQSLPMRTTRRRYRKMYPGEKEGITEEMRFVAMKLKNSGKPRKPKVKKKSVENDEEIINSDEEVDGSDSLGEESNENGESWEPSVEGFLKYLVDSKHVFSTIERIVDESSDVSYVYFRKTGLERADCIARDLEWFSQGGNSIPEPSNPGITYAKYLEEISDKTPALFMCHFYNIYFSHIAGGQVIAKKVSKKILAERELEFFKWERNEEELLRGVRENLNMLGEGSKNKMLKGINKSLPILGADCPADHLMTQFRLDKVYEQYDLTRDPEVPNDLKAQVASCYRLPHWQIGRM